MNLSSTLPGSKGFLGLLAGILLTIGSLHAQSFSKIVSFGDSWSDTGNVNELTGGFYPSTLVAPYANGRYTNGEVWVEYLATYLGVSKPVASRTSTVGTNFAYADARLDDDSRQVGPWRILEVGGQVNNYLSRFTPSGSELFTFFAGGNDIATYDPDLSDEIARLGGYVGSIYAAGGRDFLIANMPDFGKFGGYTGNTTLSLASSNYNSLLDAQLATLRLTYSDARFYEADFHGVLEKVYANPAAYNFNPALKDISYTEHEFYKRQDLGNYMWIDDLHPTTKLHDLFAKEAYNAIMVPEPSVLALCLPGAALLFKRRRQDLPSR